MSGVNKCTLLGRLGKDPELRYTAGGVPVCNFSLATSETWKDDKGQKQEKTEWHRVVIWNKMAELCQTYLKKGNVVYLEGKMQTRSWEDKDGSKKWVTEVQATSIQFLPQGQPGGNRPPEPPAPDAPPPGKTFQDNSSWGGTDFSSPPQEPPQDWTPDNIPF